ncbi:MAG TPA: SusD/RagB family nutrient-binding outer membrane lipoprotein [Segatella copri]|nr:SusD/RagB family nutrient-binding outer membrane lipoprotein [Segatella copri]
MDECYEGLPCGDKPTTDETTDGGIGISKSSRMKQAYDDAVYLMNEAECELMIAEAYARLGNAEKAEEYYNKGVLAGFSRWGFDGTAFVDGAYKFDKADMLHSIAMQYWVTYAGANAYDGWMTRNRLGIPEVQANITVRKSTTALQRELSDGYVLGNLVDPGASNMNAGEYPMRLLYPTATTLYNSAAAKYVEENGNSLTKKLWWEK